MRLRIWIVVGLVICGPGRSTPGGDLPLPPADPALVRAIVVADGSYSLAQLTGIVEACNKRPPSAEIARALTGWLRENHPIYADRLPTESNQFRGYLLSALRGFPPNAELCQYVKSELSFAGHPFNIAAAAATARSFPDHAAELIPLLEPFLRDSYEDEWVDITTPQLNYPLVHPTRARREIIETLRAFGAPAYRLLPVLDKIAACKDCGTYGRDPSLQLRAKQAAEYLREITPPCCRKEIPGKPERHRLVLVEQEQRKALGANSVALIDQNGRTLKFSDFAGTPFVLTFFYTQCPNALKCVSTVHRLGQLEAEFAKTNFADKVAIFGMTYDPYFDTPSILEKYGKLYGVHFNDRMRFLRTPGSPDPVLRDQLQLRVSYGAGSVNQHGVQLFLFDKRGRLAAIYDNELWSVADVKSCLLALVSE
jgi:cytochrome oxidase Cu insertion factor (SCO1/SenC/PrrC family)